MPSRLNSDNQEYSALENRNESVGLVNLKLMANSIIPCGGSRLPANNGLIPPAIDQVVVYQPAGL
jgi:hypothetical protein